MTVFNARTRFFGLDGRNVYHFVRNRSRKYDKHIGTADLVFKICRALGKNLAFTSVFFAYLFILTVHSVVTADNNNAHGSPPWLYIF
jgi:hypothetical protein